VALPPSCGALRPAPVVLAGPPRLDGAREVRVVAGAGDAPRRRSAASRCAAPGGRRQGVAHCRMQLGVGGTGGGEGRGRRDLGGGGPLRTTAWSAPTSPLRRGMVRGRSGAPGPRHGRGPGMARTPLPESACGPATATSARAQQHGPAGQRAFDVPDAARRRGATRSPGDPDLLPLPRGHPGAMARRRGAGPAAAGRLLPATPTADNPFWLKKAIFDLCTNCHAEKASGLCCSIRLRRQPAGKAAPHRAGWSRLPMPPRRQVRFTVAVRRHGERGAGAHATQNDLGARRRPPGRAGASPDRRPSGPPPGPPPRAARRAGRRRRWPGRHAMGSGAAAAATPQRGAAAWASALATPPRCHGEKGMATDAGQTPAPPPRDFVTAVPRRAPVGLAARTRTCSAHPARLPAEVGMPPFSSSTTASVGDVPPPDPVAPLEEDEVPPPLRSAAAASGAAGVARRAGVYAAARRGATAPAGAATPRSPPRSVHGGSRCGRPTSRRATSCASALGRLPHPGQRDGRRPPFADETSLEQRWDLVQFILSVGPAAGGQPRLRALARRISASAPALQVEH
jgi:cytochrome c553